MAQTVGKKKTADLSFLMMLWLPNTGKRASSQIDLIGASVKRWFEEHYKMQIKQINTLVILSKYMH